MAALSQLRPWHPIDIKKKLGKTQGLDDLRCVQLERNSWGAIPETEGDVNQEHAMVDHWQGKHCLATLGSCCGFNGQMSTFTLPSYGFIDDGIRP